MFACEELPVPHGAPRILAPMCSSGDLGWTTVEGGNNAEPTCVADTNDVDEAKDVRASGAQPAQQEPAGGGDEELPCPGEKFFLKSVVFPKMSLADAAWRELKRLNCTLVLRSAMQTPGAAEDTWLVAREAIALHALHKQIMRRLRGRKTI